MCCFPLFLLLTACVCLASKNGTRAGRDSSLSMFKPFPFLHIIRFANDECETESGFSGTCYTSQECDELKGSIHGDCADGYGVCCFVTHTCRETVHHNISHFVPPTHPERERNANVCPLKIAHEANICQIRLDFIRFDILGPRAGDCVDDLFVVLGANPNHEVPVICGENTNQHIYINVDTVEGPIELQMITGIAPYARDWRIKVSMIPCESNYMAPSGCLQYTTGISGNIRSFNFHQRNETRLGYLNRVDYAICLRRERDMCSIKYSVRTTDDVDSLSEANDTTPYGAPEAILRGLRDQLPVKVPAFGIATSDVKPMDLETEAKVGPSKCTGDYLSIFGLGRFCGGAFSLTSGSKESQSITVKHSGPLVVLFKSDKTFNGRGFNFDFHQGPCTPQTYF